MKTKLLILVVCVVVAFGVTYAYGWGGGYDSIVGSWDVAVEWDNGETDYSTRSYLGDRVVVDGSLGMGIWKRTGPRTFKSVATGYWQEENDDWTRFVVTQTIRVNSTFDRFVAEFVVQEFAADGTLGWEGTATSYGTRMKFE